MPTPSEASMPVNGSKQLLAEHAPDLRRMRGLDWLRGEGWRQSFRSEKKAHPLSILDRYLIAECAGPFAIGIIAFAVFLLINQFFLAAEFVLNKHVPFMLVAQYLVLQIPSFVYMIFPFSIMFGVLQGFGRLAGENELTAMRTSGIALERIARPIFAAGILLTVAAFLVNDFVAPASQHKSQVVFRQIAYNASQPIIEPDQFVRTEDGTHTIFVGSMNSQTGEMHDVAIYATGNGNFPDVLTAASGRQMNGKLVLFDGVHTVNGANGLVTKQTHFDRLDFPLADASLLFEGPRGPFEMSSSELAHQIKALRGSGEDTSQMEMVLQMKYAMPLACLVSILIAVPLAVRFGKRGREVGAMLALIVLLIYWLAITAFNTLGKSGAMPPVLAAWLPNIVMAAVGGALIWKEGR
jgi:lipopolysaccharide export system permease protein